MTGYFDLKNYFDSEKFDRVIIVSEAEPRKTIKEGTEFITKAPAGGVSIALESVAKASSAIYIGRARDETEREVLDKEGKLKITDGLDSYTLKRLFFPPDLVQNYYDGFANQTLWPLCHVSFEEPKFEKEWYDGYKTVNKGFADAIQEEIKGKTFIWINDYQLSLVPLFLGRPKNTTIGMFWHIPWPTWEVFRVLPWKKDILWSMLSCNYLAFHRNYQAQNFLRTVDQEFETRIDQETHRVFFNNQVTTVTSLPLGIDVEALEEALPANASSLFLPSFFKSAATDDESPYDHLFEKYRVLIGVDRLDYTKGLPRRLRAIDEFFTMYPENVGKVIYLGIIAPSRESVPSYQRLKDEVVRLEKEINKKHAIKGWQPLHLIHKSLPREALLTLYQQAKVCLVTPLDDGMNLVSKEFVVAAAHAKEPGVLILSEFAGSAIDLTESLLVNPYDISSVARAIQHALLMDKTERKERMEEMAAILGERNLYEWALAFVKGAKSAGTQNTRGIS